MHAAEQRCCWRGVLCRFQAAAALMRGTMQLVHCCGAARCKRALSRLRAGTAVTEVLRWEFVSWLPGVHLRCSVLSGSNQRVRELRGLGAKMGLACVCVF